MQKAEATVAPRRSFFRADATQRLLAFAGLIVIFVGFSLASPYFLEVDNMMGILLATAVNGSWPWASPSSSSPPGSIFRSAR